MARQCVAITTASTSGGGNGGTASSFHNGGVFNELPAATGFHLSRTRRETWRSLSTKLSPVHEISSRPPRKIVVALLQNSPTKARSDFLVISENVC